MHYSNNNMILKFIFLFKIIDLLSLLRYIRSHIPQYCYLDNINIFFILKITIHAHKNIFFIQYYH